MAKPYQRIGDAAFSKIEKVNSELFTLTYGSLVSQLVKDYEDVAEVNKQLDKMGYNIGARLIDEFLAKSNITRCVDFRETAEVIGKVAFRMFLGIVAQVVNWNPEGTECSFIIDENPLNDFVELPESAAGLLYSNILCGVIRGALEQINMKVECHFLKDALRGDDTTEIRLSLKELLQETYHADDD
eukprot:tig00000402_g205.t1